MPTNPPDAPLGADIARMADPTPQASRGEKALNKIGKLQTCIVVAKQVAH